MVPCTIGKLISTSLSLLACLNNSIQPQKLTNTKKQSPLYKTISYIYQLQYVFVCDWEREKRNWATKVTYWYHWYQYWQLGDFHLWIAFEVLYHCLVTRLKSLCVDVLPCRDMIYFVYWYLIVVPALLFVLVGFCVLRLFMPMMQMCKMKKGAFCFS